MTASAAATPKGTGTPPRYPLYMRALVDRATMLLKAHGDKFEPVRFTYFQEGEDVAYLGRVEWADDDGCPLGLRVVVFNAQTGDFVCRSLVGDVLEIDPSMVNTDHVGLDSDARARWEHDQAVRRD